jgi:hypothetical protein
MDLYSGSSLATRTVPIGAGNTVTTRHGITLVVEPAATAPRADRLIVPGVTTTDRIDPRIMGWAAGHALEVERPSLGSAHEFGFDPMLRDLAEHGDRASALMAAKFSEYPSTQLQLSGAAWPWRPTALFGAALLLCLGIGLLPTVARRVSSARRHRADGRTA